MSGRKLNALELKIHQTALADKEKTLTIKEVEELAPDVAARKSALNFLLGTGMLKALRDAKGSVSFRVVLKKEMDLKKDMTGEESMVLSHIQASANEGIWTKHLKAKTELHQTVIDRCLKSLTQKGLVKSIKSVKHPTRKIYMLSHLEPSVEITGGPWYTDNELDTEFIKLLSTACLHYIKDRSFPKTKRSEKSSSRSQPLYPIGSAPSYPTAQQIQSFLSKSKITETQLQVDHIEMLLNVLVLDGEIEKIPAFGAAMWDSQLAGDDASGSDNETHEKKRKRKSDKDSHKSKRRKRSREDDSDSEDEDEDEGSRKSRSKGRKKDASSDSDESDVSVKRKSKKKKRKHNTDTDDTDSSSDEDQRRKNKRKKKSKKKHDSFENSSDSSSESESDRPRRKRASRKRSPSPLLGFGTGEMDEALGGAYVYRAIRQERVALGWSQAPCGHCPVFDFCKDKGPVNPRECPHYKEWLGNATVAIE